MDDFAPPMTDEMMASRWASFMLHGHDQGEYELAARRRLAPDDGLHRHRPRCSGTPLTILRDITEHKLAEELIERQWRRLLEAQAIAGVGTWDCDLLTGKVEWSSECYRTYGVEPGASSPSRTSSSWRTRMTASNDGDPSCGPRGPSAVRPPVPHSSGPTASCA